MRKKYKLIICIVIIILLLLSIAYMNTNHEYDISTANEIETDKEFINVEYNKEESIEDESALGILYIEKINLTATVKEGSTEDILKEYVGHITETDLYDGNIGLAAHNRLNTYSYFARLNELQIGDKVVYKTKFYTRTYEVNKKEVIFDTDWSYLKKSKENKLTMITCITNKPNERLCVQAIEI